MLHSINEELPLKSKKLFKVSIPFLFAISDISFAGSIPNTLNPSCLKKESNVPSLDPISIIISSNEGLKLSIRLLEYSSKCFMKTGEVPETYT